MAWPNVTRCTIPFIQTQYGWTENYVLDSVSSTLATEMTALYNLAAKRIKLCGADTYVSYLKVSNEANLRDVLVMGLGPNGVTPFVGTAGQASDFQDTALLVNRVTADNLHSAPLYLRGLWDSWIAAGGQFNLLDATFISLFNSFAAQLIGSGFGFLGKSSASPPRTGINSVTSVGGQVQIVASGNLFTGLTVGTKIKVFISGVQGAAAINGSQICTVTSANSCTTIKRIPIFPYTAGGFITGSLPFFYPIGQMRTVRTVERKAGRPLYLSRGRARARKLS